jgi:rhodanese-related sulfurtransferase
MAKKVRISSILRRMAEEDALLIDVTDQDAFDNLHLANAINIPYERLDEDIREKIDPSHPVITYSNDFFCPISAMAARKLEEMGYTRVSYYQGGKQEWLEAGMPVEGLQKKSNSGNSLIM